ncbi:MAG: erythromycin esterase family protein, partial [Vicingaceae bacterium]
MVKFSKKYRLNIINFLLFGFLFFSVNTIYSQDTTGYINLSSTELINNDADLKQLDVYFKNVTVVGMGESTHGTHEFFKLRHRVFKYLVENHHFNTFFLEADYANCLRANAYIQGNKDNVEAVVREINMWPWKTTEMMNLINWMRDYNLKNKNNQINFIGVDMQQYVETVKQMDNILRSNDLPTTDSVIYQKMLATNFFLVT